jgi:exodeoxyribonuclease VII small subunit
MTTPDPGIEARIRRLEEIAAALENDDVELDAALALFSEGVENVRAARTILRHAELTVERLIAETEADTDTNTDPDAD